MELDVLTTQERLTSIVLQKDGTALPSATSELLEQNTDEKGIIRNEEAIASTTGVMFAGNQAISRISVIEYNCLSTGGADTVRLEICTDYSGIYIIGSGGYYNYVRYSSNGALSRGLA